MGCDADWNEGYSSVELIRTERGTALFRGNISSRLPKVRPTQDDLYIASCLGWQDHTCRVGGYKDAGPQAVLAKEVYGLLEALHALHYKGLPHFH